MSFESEQADFIDRAFKFGAVFTVCVLVWLGAFLTSYCGVPYIYLTGGLFALTAFTLVWQLAAFVFDV